MDQQQITFITPENVSFSVNYMELKDFCREMCIKFTNISEENRKLYEDFSNNYSYFDPCYDFLICVVKWISYPSLIDQASYVQRGCNDDRIILRKMPVQQQHPFSYQDLYMSTSYGNELYCASDKNIGLSVDKKDYISIDGYLDYNGNFFSTRTTCSHKMTSDSILNGICSDFNLCIPDVLEAKKTRSSEDCLIERLGFICACSYRGHDTVILNPLLISTKQKNEARRYLELGFTFFEAIPDNVDVNKLKSLINKFYENKNGREY